MVERLPVPDEAEAMALEAAEARRLDPAQRVELFCSIMQVIQEVWASLPPAEQWRRIRIAERLDPAPRPWWTGLAPGARP
jgi:hypothetical protein